MKERNLYFDCVKGMAILMVIAIHTFNPENVNYDALCVRQLLNVAVPLFLACSGFFIGKKTFNTSTERRSWLKHQIQKVYLPVLVWSLPYLVFPFLRRESMLTNLALYFLCGYSVYYFIAVIIQCYLLTSPLKQLNEKYGYIAVGGGNFITFN